MAEKMTFEQGLTFAEQIRKACIAATREGYQSAAMSGLCHEGATEAAISAVQLLDLKQLVRAHLDLSTTT